MHATFRLLLLLFGLALTAACSAHNDNPVANKNVANATYTSGKQYVALSTQGQPAATGPVVLMEVFSYGCPHCAEFAPYMDKLSAQLPAGVQVRYLPAIFNADWVPYARAYYAAKQLGILAQTHDALFAAMLQHYPLNSLDDLADFYAQHGTTAQQFLAAANSPQTDAQMAADQKTEQGWGIDATPTLLVGRAQSAVPDAPFVPSYRSAEVADYAELQKLGAWLVQREVQSAHAK